MSFPFTVPPTDQSYYYLSQIFGQISTVLVPSSGGAPAILGTLFRIFNSFVLVVAGVVVLYITVVGALKTAQEGEFLGREWNSIWIPLRVVFGVAALVPSASGYCALQIVIMWIVVQSIGAADTIWNTVLTYSSAFGSPIAPVSVPTTGVNGNMSTLFKSLTCQAHAKATYNYHTPGTTDKGGYYCAGRKDGFCTQSNNEMLNIMGSQSTHETGTSNGATVYTIKYNIGPSGSCGSMTFSDADKVCADTSTPEKVMACSTARAQQSALQSTVSVLGGIGAQFASADYEYRVFYDTGPEAKPPSWVSSYCSAAGYGQNQCCRPLETSSSTSSYMPPPQSNKDCQIGTDLSSGDYNNAAQNAVTLIYWPYYFQANVVGNTDFITTSANNYTTSLNTAVTSASPTVQQGFSNSILQQASTQGWIMAGAYYYYLSSSNKATVNAEIPLLATAGTDPAAYATGNPLYNQRNNFQGAAYLLNAASQTINTLTASLPQGLESVSELSNGLTSTATDMTNWFTETITGAKPGELASNPLAALQSLGNVLLKVAQALFAATMLLIPAMLAGWLNVLTFPVATTNPIGPIISSMTIFFAPLYTLLVGTLFLFGATLAIYTPLIPYVIFTMAAVGWFILVIEAMVAAPIVALGILTPGGHEIFGHAQQSLYHLLGLFLRPSLMVFGMIAAMLLATVVVTMINAGFAGVMASIYGKEQLWLVELIIFGCAYVGLVMAALNKCFAMIYIVPDRVLTWIGGAASAEAAELAAAGLGGAEKGTSAGAVAGAAYGKEMASKERIGTAGKAISGFGKAVGKPTGGTGPGPKIGGGGTGGTGGGGASSKGGATPPTESPPEGGA